ncbi:MAG: hypothetical protein R3360_06205, partial [Alphaproteobacteria bacterium]|nr:hypothetical protein [Alphaproteobacteria bacterium]
DVDMRGIDRPIDDTFRKAVPPEREPKRVTQDWEGLKPGYGREDTYYACVTCHSIHRIKRSFKTREEWAETLRWLEEERNVPPLEDDEREVVLTYLATQYGPEEPK